MATQGVWFIRIVGGVAHSFPVRWIEWLMGLWALAWALKWLLDPADNFSTPSGAWLGLKYLFGSDTLFSGGMALFGVLRLAALTVNGTFYDTIYARYSPLVRGITAALCGMAWLCIWLSSSASNSQGVVNFCFPMAIEFFTAYFVVTESADVLRNWRNGRSSKSG